MHCVAEVVVAKRPSFLFSRRCTPIQRGLVTIEGKTISSKRNARTIREHRQFVSVLSQDPLLFVGTVRENLLGPGTPERYDSDLWEALQQVGLSGKIAAMEQKLDAPVEEGGSNFFLRRKAAILYRSRLLLSRKSIVLCDEATANVDLDSDARIHDVLLSLPSTTVLMICHRLQYIHRFDAVHVLGAKGKLLESDTPARLLEDPGSALNLLYREAGL